MSGQRGVVMMEGAENKTYFSFFLSLLPATIQFFPVKTVGNFASICIKFNRSVQVEELFFREKLTNILRRLDTCGSWMDPLRKCILLF